ncbi:hypothetical protein [uncultured Tateyamaria sp.]|uniref:hypothetical protein n=1 Tax=uncultured Tateyamaria sp. TaxID=455651 RepID=UPI00262ECE75|nr:hypothetical protein [uncultured Tateyamaria sp.]
MKFSHISEQLRKYRLAKSGRSMNAAMRVQEIWDAVEASEHSSIGRINLSVEMLERPIDGMFVRLVSSGEEPDVAHVFVHRDLHPHWKEFVAVKEMMHCFTPPEKYASTPLAVSQLFDELSSVDMPYTPRVAADDDGLLAAAEMILPHSVVEPMIAAEMDEDQIAAHHGLHPDIVRFICRLDVLHMRKNGSF